MPELKTEYQYHIKRHADIKQNPIVYNINSHEQIQEIV